MRAVLKYPIKDGEYSIAIPSSAIVAHVAFQKSVPTVWAVCDDEGGGTRHVFLFPTGQDVLRDDLKFVGTLINDSQTFVLHAFEEPRR